MTARTGHAAAKAAPSRKAAGGRPALAAIADTAERLASGLPLEAILQPMLEGLRAAVGADACSLWVPGAEGLVRRAAAGEGAAESDMEPGRAAVMTDRARHVREGGRSAFVSPIAFGGRTLGVLVVSRTRPLADDAQHVVQTVAHLLVHPMLGAERAHTHAEELERSQRALAEQHRFLERVMDSLPVGVHVVDRSYRIHAWNRKRETGLQGILREEAIGRTIFEVLRRQPADVLRREFDEVFESGSITQFEMESLASGDARIYRVSKIPMRMDDGAVTHVITIGEDVTDWRRAQERIAQAQKLAAIGQLAAGIMHEINNPLATMGAAADNMVIALDDPTMPPPLRESLSEYCRIIDHEVHRAKRIVDGLLDFSRTTPASLGLVELARVVDETLFLLKHHARFRKMRVEPSLDRDAGANVHGSAEQLVQVLMALLLNGADAMGGDGRLRVRTRRDVESREMLLEVEDEGVGIAPSEIPKLFEPFYTTKAPGRGTGLGLSICYGIVADHGGRIEVESAVGTGSTFRVCLPMRELA